MSVQLLPCAYQRHVNKNKCEQLCEQFTVLKRSGLSRSLQAIITGYLVEVSCMSSRQVKEGGAPTIEVAVAFFKENALRVGSRLSGRLVAVSASLTFEHRRLSFDYILKDDPSKKFDLCILNSWRYSLFNLHPYSKTYEKMTERMPVAPTAYEERVCFHELSAKCIGQSTLDLPDVDEDHRDEVEDAMRVERDAVTKELIAAAAEKRT